MIGNSASLVENSANPHQQQQHGGASTAPSPSTPTSPTRSSSTDRVHRQVLSQATAVICQTTGFTSIHSGALEMLTSIQHKFLNDVCRSSREHCEHTGRSVVTPGDVFVALAGSGLDLRDFPEFLLSLHQTRPATLTLKSQSPVKSPPLLRISEPRPHPSHFPSFLPSFPDPHTYIRTEVKDDVDSNYEKVRRLTARNRREIESSLVNYALSVYPSVCVFQEYAKRLQFEAKDKIEREQLVEQQHQTSDGPKPMESLNGEVSASELENGNEDDERETQASKGQTIRATTNLENNGMTSKPAGSTSATTVQDLLLSEEQFRLKETERSYVLKRIPAYCHILLPFEEQQPYISALVTDDIDVEEEDHNYFANILSKEMEEDLAENDEDEPMEVGADV